MLTRYAFAILLHKKKVEICEKEIFRTLGKIFQKTIVNNYLNPKTK